MAMLRALCLACLIGSLGVSCSMSRGGKGLLNPGAEREMNFSFHIFEDSTRNMESYAMEVDSNVLIWRSGSKPRQDFKLDPGEVNLLESTYEKFLNTAIIYNQEGMKNSWVYFMDHSGREPVYMEYGVDSILWRLKEGVESILVQRGVVLPPEDNGDRGVSFPTSYLVFLTVSDNLDPELTAMLDSIDSSRVERVMIGNALEINVDTIRRPYILNLLERISEHPQVRSVMRNEEMKRRD